MNTFSKTYDRGLVLQMGAIISLSIMLVAFRWHRPAESSAIQPRYEPPLEVVSFEQLYHLPPLPKQSNPMATVDGKEAQITEPEPSQEQWPEANPLPGSLPGIPDEFVDTTDFFVPGDEIFPRFPGGNEALMRYLSKNLCYNSTAIEFGISGRVFISFVVQADGSIAEVKVLKGLGYGLDEEAVRVVKAMPRWLPGTQNGRPVAVVYNLPIQFSLRKN